MIAFPAIVIFFRFGNPFIITSYVSNCEQIHYGLTDTAYIMPELFISLLNLGSLQLNGRPLYHVIKQPIGIV